MPIDSSILRPSFFPLKFKDLFLTTYYLMYGVCTIILKLKVNLFFPFRHKSCIPSASGKIKKNIPVWLYPLPGVSGPVDPECSVVTLEGMLYLHFNDVIIA